MKKRFLVIMAMIVVQALAVMAATSDKGGWFVIKPNDTPEDQTFVVTDFASNLNSHPAHKYSFTVLGDSAEVTLYFNQALTESLVVFSPPGTGWQSWQRGDPEVWKVKVDRRSTLGYFSFNFFFRR